MKTNKNTNIPNNRNKIPHSNQTNKIGLVRQTKCGRRQLRNSFLAAAPVITHTVLRITALWGPKGWKIP